MLHSVQIRMKNEFDSVLKSIFGEIRRIKEDIHRKTNRIKKEKLSKRNNGLVLLILYDFL